MYVAGLSFAAVLLLGDEVPAAPIIVVDENGNGAIDFRPGGPLFLTPGVLRADPGPGGLPSVLTYDLLSPPGLVAGDLLLMEGVGGPFRDVIRFNPAGTGSAGYRASLLFYSDNTDGYDSLGDTPGAPSQIYTNARVTLEIGTEGNNGAIYTPGPADPGFVPGFAVTYSFVSDGSASAIPEPRSLVMGGIAAAIGLVLAGHRRWVEAA
jgi:hypothetical protein